MCFCSCRKWSALLKIQRSPSSACATIGTTRRLDLWPTTASISASRDREWNKSRYSHICPVYSFQYRWCLSRCANTNQSFAWQTCVFFNARAWRFSALSSCTEVSPDCQNLLRRLTVDDNSRKLFTILHRGTLFWNCSAVFCRLVSLCLSLLLRTFFSVRFIFNTLSCHCPFAC